jgi:hypothetical protein
VGTVHYYRQALIFFVLLFRPQSLKLKADLVAALEEAIGEGSPAPVEPEKPAKRAGM